VAVAAIALIAQQQLRVFGTKYRRETLRCLVDVGPRKPDAARRVIVEDGPVTAVGIAEAFNALNTENVCTGTKFIYAGAVDLITHTSIGSCDDNYPMSRR
jgi:hypothetical protein